MGWRVAGRLLTILCWLSEQASISEAGGTAEVSGSRHAVELLNHRWVASCPNISSSLLSPPTIHPPPLGPCPTDYTVILLPPLSLPRYVLNASCSADCSGSYCSSLGAFKCVNLPRQVRTWIVDDPFRPRRAWPSMPVLVSAGCVCSSKKNTSPTSNTPPLLRFVS